VVKYKEVLLLPIKVLVAVALKIIQKDGILQHTSGPLPVEVALVNLEHQDCFVQLMVKDMVAAVVGRPLAEGRGVRRKVLVVQEEDRQQVVIILCSIKELMDLVVVAEVGLG
jgi:hypothetical protein